MFGPLPFLLQASHVDFVFPPPSPMPHHSVAFEVVLWELLTSPQYIDLNIPQLQGCLVVCCWGVF